MVRPENYRPTPKLDPKIRRKICKIRKTLRPQKAPINSSKSVYFVNIQIDNMVRPQKEPPDPKKIARAGGFFYNWQET